MNIKSVALASALALGSIFGGMAPAEAASSTCWIAGPGETASANYCDHYLPEKGVHVVYMYGSRYEFHLYTDGTAKFYIDGGSAVRGTWTYHQKGGIQVRNSYNGYWFLFDRD